MRKSIHLTAYTEFTKATDLRRHKDNKKLLIRFIFRYRLAKNFKEIIADDIGRTIKGYNVVLKIFLTYTAYEQLLRASAGLYVFGLGSVDKNRIINKPLANKLRSNEQLINFLIEHSDKGELLSQLVAFRDDKSDDIVCVAYAIRNVFAHGELTATAIGTSKATERKHLMDLADYLLNYCDETFTKCVEKLR